MTEPTTRAAQIRDWLATQTGPQSPDAIADALGYPAHCHHPDGSKTDRMRLHWTVGEMCRKGLLVRTGDRCKGFLYALGRPPTARLSAEELRLRRNARMRAYEAARRTGMTAAEYNAYRKKKAQEKREARAKQRAQNAALDRAQAIVRKLKAESVKPKPTPAPKPRPRNSSSIVIPPKPLPPTQPAPVVQRFETVEEWMARTGKAPEVLPVHWNRAA